MAGSNLQKKLDWKEKEVPGDHHGQVGIGVVGPVVVDVEAVLIEIAHVHAVAIGGQEFACFHLIHRKSSFTTAKDGLYALSPEFYLGVDLLKLSHLRQKQTRSSISISDHALLFRLENNIPVNQAKMSRRAETCSTRNRKAFLIYLNCLEMKRAPDIWSANADKHQGLKGLKEPSI